MEVRRQSLVLGNIQHKKEQDVEKLQILKAATNCLENK